MNPCGFDLLDVDRVGAVQNRQVAGEVGLLDQVAHDGQRHFAHVNAAERAAAEAQNFQAHAVLSRFRIAVQVALLLQRAQDVAGGTLWNLQLAADFGVGQAFRFLGDGLQHG